jgi:hypothetical protein
LAEAAGEGDAEWDAGPVVAGAVTGVPLGGAGGCGGRMRSKAN